MKYLNRPIEIKAVNEDGLFSGYASVFEEIDSYRDIVKRALSRRRSQSPSPRVAQFPSFGSTTRPSPSAFTQS